MKPKHKRLVLVLFSLAVMGGAATAVLTSFRDSLVFFYTPTQWQQKQKAGNISAAELRIGGLVKEGSVATTDDGTMRFTITDLTHELPVRYRGMVPVLFREGQGVVAQGSIGSDGTLTARTILAKHDENYMPREVVEALKQSGRWKHTE